MSEVSTRLQISSSLLRALDVITNRRAFLSLVGGFILVALLSVFFGYVGARLVMGGHTGLAAFLEFIGLILNLLVALTAYSACGLHVHRQLVGLPALPLGTGFMAGATTVPRLLGLGVLTAAGVIAVVLVLLLVYFVCKIPLLGQLLYFVALPVGTLIVGVLALAIAFLLPLFGPAVWSGHGVLQSVAVLWGILKARLFSVVVNTLLLGLLVGVIGGLVFSAYFEGVFVNLGLSAVTLGPVVHNLFGGLGMLFGSLGGMGDAGAASGAMGYVAGGSLGLLLLGVALAAVPVMVAIGGHCVIFYAATEDLEIGALESQLRDRMAGAQKQIQDVARQAREKAAQGSAAATASTAPAAVVPKCPHCGQPVEGGDAFCGNCGKPTGV